MATSDEDRFADSVRRLREGLGWSQAELSRRMVDAGWETYSQMTVSRTEKHERPIRLSEARALAKLLGSTLEDMVGVTRDDERHVFDWKLRNTHLEMMSKAGQLTAMFVDAGESALRALDTLNEAEPNVALLADADKPRAEKLIQDARTEATWILETLKAMPPHTGHGKRQAEG